MLLAVAAYVAVQYVYGGKPEPRCTVVSGNGDGASYTFTAEQARNASTVAVVGTSRGMPERAVTIALATALQESGLHNLGRGDRDSLGLFQQRPSQGWGDERQIMDPAYASARFYAHLAEVPGYSRLPLTVAAQRVQRSGYPQAYAKHEPDAALLAAALTGRAPATLSCEGRPGPDPGGAAKVRAALVRDFGRAVRPADTGGRTVSVPVASAATTAADGGAPARGWELAHWAVAQSSALGIERVSYAGREWRARDGGDSGGSGGSGGSGDGAGQWHRTAKDRGNGAAGPARDTAEVRIVTGQ